MGVCVCVWGGGGRLGVVGVLLVEYSSNVEETNRERTVFISPTKK